jgi:ABC-type Fe3+-siderophore transport system permease subunit
MWVGKMNGDLKLIIRRSVKTSIAILIYGLVIREKTVYIGAFLGSLISILSLYMIKWDVEAVLNSKNPFRVSIGGYLKRYLVYGLFLLALMYFGHNLFFGGVLGLLNVKFNLLINEGVKYFNKLKSKISKI